LLDRFDEVLVMREGKLVAQGTPDELALSSAEFQRLTSLQPRDMKVAAVTAMNEPSYVDPGCRATP
jgi:ABC-type multidrug transport system ATPase subunit